MPSIGTAASVVGAVGGRNLIAYRPESGITDKPVGTALRKMT